MNREKTALDHGWELNLNVCHYGNYIMGMFFIIYNKSIAKEIKKKNGLAGDICLFSLKMSDTERLREEYNQLVEGKVLHIFVNTTVNCISSNYRRN